MILSVDPGAKHCGLALWNKNKLALAWLQPVDGGSLGLIHNRIGAKAMRLTEIIVERPQIYSPRFLRGDPNDLVTIAIVGAELAGFLRAYHPAVVVEYVYPKTWKGQIKKGAQQPDILAELSEREMGMVELPRAKALAHNIIDAVGLGLYHLGRSERGKRAGRKTA